MFIRMRTVVMMRFMVVIELIHRCFWAFTTSTPSFKFPAQVVADILCNSQLLLPLLSKHIRAVLISSHDTALGCMPSPGGDALDDPFG